MSTKPENKPACPNFSSGPCAKHHNYSVAEAIPTEILGRSHRSALGKNYLGKACADTATILGLPEGYRVGIVPASDTGAMEMIMWSVLGPKNIDILAWESFGEGWVSDVTGQLKLKDQTRVFKAKEYGLLPEGIFTADAEKRTVDAKANDVIFTWNGTTSGVKMPNADWIPDDREGITICDATSAVFAMDMPWEKLDAVTFSWQKVLGGEGGHGVLVLSPRAVARLESHQPTWPMPKIFRLTNAKTGKLAEGIFKGDTINTPSMMCVADYLDALKWVTVTLGGLDKCIAKSNENLKTVETFVEDNSSWIQFLAKDKTIRSNTSVCFVFPQLPASEDGSNEKKVAAIIKLLGAQEQVAFDIGSYRDAPLGIRIWCGATVEQSDLELLLPWLKYAYDACTAAA